MPDISQRERELLAELASLRRRVAREETKEFSSSAGAVDSVNGATGVVVLDQDDVGDGTTYKQYSATEKTKLAGIETAADVTDAGNIASSIHGATLDVAPLDADEVPGLDSSASFALIRTTWTSIKAFLKTYFDGLYGLLGTANTWTKNNTIASTTTTGNALRVVRDLASASTDAAVADIVQDNVGDDQAGLRVQQDGTGNILELYDGATLVEQVADGGVVTYPLGFVIYGSDTATGPSMGINGAAGVVRQLYFRTAGVLRWVLRADSVAESGSNVGSNLEILRRTDAGGALETLVHMQRATGRIGIGDITAPAGRMDISQGSSTAAVPVLVLRQGDVSEELIEVVSTAGAGNTVDTAALGAYAGKIRITVNGTYYYLPFYN